MDFMFILFFVAIIAVIIADGKTVRITEREDGLKIKHTGWLTLWWDRTFHYGLIQKEYIVGGTELVVILPNDLTDKQHKYLNKNALGWSIAYYMDDEGRTLEITVKDDKTSNRVLKYLLKNYKSTQAYANSDYTVGDQLKDALIIIDE